MDRESTIFQADRVKTLVLVALAGQATGYALSIVVARQLGIQAFEDYAVAATLFILLASVAPLGMEKYALRLLPALVERRALGEARGFLRVGMRVAFCSAFLLGLVVIGALSMNAGVSDTATWAIIVTCLSLPGGALAHYLVEVLSAWGQEIKASVLFRIVVPATALSLILLSTAWLGGFDASTAIGAWGIAWALAVVLFALWVRHYAPPDLFEVSPVEKGRQWIREARPFLAYRALLTLMAYASIPILDGLQTSSAAVSAFAAAMATTGFAVAMVTATNRIYGRQLSILLERRDFSQLQVVRRARIRWLAPALSLFLVVSLFFTRSLLSPFGGDFAEEGVVPLRILAIAAAVSMAFALAPTYLKFTGQNRILFSVLIFAVAVQGALLFLLVPRLSATGAAIAYASGAIVLYGSYAVAAHRALQEMRRPPR